MDTVTVFVTSDETSSERRLMLSWSIAELKAKLEPITGIPAASQQLAIFRTSTCIDPVILKEDNSAEDDKKLLQSFDIRTGGRIQVNDLRPISERLNLHDLSAVEKFELSKQDYEKLDNSVLAWKREQKLGRFNPDVNEKQHEIEAASREHVRTKGIRAGVRCMANGRKGTVKYVGEVAEIPSKIAPHQLWVGVEFDEPVGKNNGSINGHQYFECEPKFGSFIKPELVDVGDFPRDDYEAEDLDDEL